MVDLLVCWVLFVALYLVVALGFGLLVERAAGARVPGVLLAPVGVAGVFVASQVVSYFSWSARATTPVVLLIGAAGLLLGRSRLSERPHVDRAALAAAALVFAVFAAPVVLTGEPTFAGYTVLGDTSIHFIGADYILHHGRHLTGLPPSSYEFSLASYYGNGGYPSGGPTAAGVFAPVVGADIAWIFQPFLALLAAMTSLCVYALIARRVRPAWLRCFVAALAPQSALVLAYALQGSVKEVGTAWAIALLAALVLFFVDQTADGGSPRRVVPLAVAAAAGLSLISLSLAPWLGLFLLAAVLAAWRRAGMRAAATQSAVFAAITAALAFPTLAVLGTFLPTVTATVTSQKEFGNLLGRLDPLQLFGTYLAGDYRIKPDTSGLLTTTYILLGVSFVAGALGLVWAVRRRAWAPLLYVVVSVIGWAYVTRDGSPWAQAKALMIVAPAVMVAIALGPVALHDGGRRVEAVALAVVIAVGVLWSNALAYHDVSDAPWSRLVELEHVGQRIDGQGPTLYTEFEEFGKHFLAGADPESPGEGWQRRIALAAQTTDGIQIHQGQSYDLDSFTPAYVDYYRTLVLRHGPAWSRPPSIYRRVWSGRYYEIWQRRASARQVVAHLGLGSRTDAAAIPSCAAVAGLAGQARRAGGRLAIAHAADPLVIAPSHTAYPPGWAIDPSDPLSLIPTGPGKVADSFVARAAGTYDIWLEGSFGRPFMVYVDGAYLGSVGYELAGRGQAIRAGAVNWRPGRHVITVVEGGGSPYPGNGERGGRLGLISAVPRSAASGAVTYIAPAAWHTLCGRPADWIEAVR